MTEYAIGDIKNISVDELVADLKQHPAFFDTNFPPDADLPPLLEAIRQLKYDEQGPPDHVAEAYKEDGNVNYKSKKYRIAIACYEKGVSLNPPNKTLLVDLYNNIAVCHQHLGNNGSAVRNARKALDFDPANIKAFCRGATALLSLDKIDQALAWIQQGLKIDPKNPVLLELHARASTDRDLKLRNERMKGRESVQIDQLKEHIAKARVRLFPSDPWSKDSVARTPSGMQVHLANDEQHSIIWPMRLLFPEFQVQEFIDEVSEFATFQYVTKTVLEDNKPDWRPGDGRYETTESVIVAMEDETHTVLHKFSQNFNLRDAFARDGVAIENAMPTLLIFDQNFMSKIEKQYLMVRDHEVE